EPALDTQPLHLLDHVPSERVIPHPGDHAGSVTQPRRRDGDVHGAASEELAEAVDVLEPLLDLQGVDVDAAASEGDDVEVCCHGLHASCIGTWIGCRVLLCDTALLMHPCSHWFAYLSRQRMVMSARGETAGPCHPRGVGPVAPALPVRAAPGGADRFRPALRSDPATGWVRAPPSGTAPGPCRRTSFRSGWRPP